MESEEMAVFKSYLRSLLRDLKDLEKAIKEKDTEKAEQLISILIEDTQKNIEDYGPYKGQTLWQSC